MDVFSGIATAATLAYCVTGVLAFLLLLADKPSPEQPPPGGAADENAPLVSVLVAARDEEAVLPRCLAALAAQRYPRERIEFIVANDGSADATAALVEAYAADDPRWRLVRVTQSAFGLRGKANALHQAFQQSRGEIILITDADCAPPPDWARNVCGAFVNEGLGISCGVACVRAESLLEKVQALDWLLLLSVASAGSSAGLPLTAMGNNMAVRRSAYLDVGGYPALPFSVTEDYALFQAVHRHPRWRVRLSLDPATATDTLPVASLRDVFQQRKRWARGGLDAGPGAYALYLTVFLAHAVPALGLFVFPLLAAGLLLLKCGTDLVLLAFATHRLGGRRLLRAFPLFELYLFAYLTALPFALLFSPSIRWKERRY